MTTQRQWALLAMAVAVLVVSAVVATKLFTAPAAAVEVGSNAPGFIAKTLDPAPRMKSLSDYRGQVVVLNLWATYCIPCRTEMPSLEALFTSFMAQGLRVVAVSVDQGGFEQEIREFAREFKLSFEILYDDTGAIQSIYRTVGVPETFVIGRDGVIAKRSLGAEDWNSAPNRALIARLLAEPAP